MTAQITRPVLLLIMLVGSSQLWAAESIQVDLTRSSVDTWILEYSFDEPIQGLDFGNVVGDYRAAHWKVLSPGLEIVAIDGAERLISKDGAFAKARIEVTSYSEFLGDHYVAIAPFSDGGAAVYLGHFAADEMTSEGSIERPIHYLLHALDGEEVVMPGEDDRARDLTAYFGNQELQQVGQTRMILDPATPAWLEPVITDVMAKLSILYGEKLGVKLPSAPLVMIAAGELGDSPSYSVKGGAMAGQFISFSLRGRQLLEESEELRFMLQRLMAHELAHIWQQSMSDETLGVSDPWIHEGAAEAMAIAGLVEVGLWTQERRELFTRSYRLQCAEQLEDSTISQVVASGNHSVVYPCGHDQLTRDDRDVFLLWTQMTTLAQDREVSYSQRLLDEVILLQSPMQ